MCRPVLSFVGSPLDESLPLEFGEKPHDMVQCRLVRDSILTTDFRCDGLDRQSLLETLPDSGAGMIRREQASLHRVKEHHAVVMNGSRDVLGRPYVRRHIAPPVR